MLRAQNEKKSKTIIKDGLRSLLLVATSLDDECQYNAAVIYRKLCADRHTHDYVVGRGGLQALLGLVQLRGLGTQRQAAAALRDVCSNKEHKARMNGDVFLWVALGVSWGGFVVTATIASRRVVCTGKKGRLVSMQRPGSSICLCISCGADLRNELFVAIRTLQHLRESVSPYGLLRQTYYRPGVFLESQRLIPRVCEHKRRHFLSINRYGASFSSTA